MKDKNKAEDKKAPEFPDGPLVQRFKLFLVRATSTATMRSAATTATSM